jgi:hypothetical protein
MKRVVYTLLAVEAVLVGVRSGTGDCREPGGAVAGGKLSFADLECGSLTAQAFLSPVNAEER